MAGGSLRRAPLARFGTSIRLAISWLGGWCGGAIAAMIGGRFKAALAADCCSALDGVDILVGRVSRQAVEDEVVGANNSFEPSAL